MTPASAQSLAHALLLTHNLLHWSFRFNHRKRSLGLCIYNHHRIELSRHFVLANDEPAIRDTLLHEIAHALAGPAAGHGPKWKALAKKLGATPTRLDHTSIMPPGRWHATCPNCQKQFTRHRRPHRRRKYACSTCGPTKGLIHFHLQITSPVKIIKQKSSPTRIPLASTQPPPPKPLLSQLSLFNQAN